MKFADYNRKGILEAILLGVILAILAHMIGTIIGNGGF